VRRLRTAAHADWVVALTGLVVAVASLVVRFRTLTGELLAVVDQTMQPTRTSLWLRPHRFTPSG
jgi:hypothetical protein